MTRSARMIWAFAAAFVVGLVPELVRAWPTGARGPVIALVAFFAVAFTAVWALALAGGVAGTAAALARVWPRRDDRADLTWLPVLGPAAWLLLTLGERVNAVAARMFVRQDLAAAVVPVATLLIIGAVGLGAALLHRAVAPRLARLTPRALVAVGALGGGLALTAHLARFPVIFTDALAPVAAQLLAASAASVAAYLLARRGPGRRAAIALTVGVVLLGGAALLAERVAPRSAPAALAAVGGRGLAAARLAPLLQRALGVGDADGDGFSRFAGGDCDDGDARVHPYAVDVPDDGVDQDCFEGDLTRAARDAARPPPPATPPARAANLLLITVDAMRADAPGFAAPPGRAGPPTPTMDALAARGVVFTRAYSQAPMTRRAFPALLASRYPSNVTWMDLRTKYPYTVSHDANLFLAEVARDAGLATTAVVAFSYARNSRFNQGFAREIIHKASASPREINADKIAADGVAQLEAWAADPAHPRFMLWLHFYDAHMPYVTHPGIAVGKSEHERYQGEIAWIDSQLARVMAALETTGLAATTAVAFTGDHGEEFGEHGGTAHGDLYVEDLHVPLVIAGPGLAPRQVATPVGLVDVAPTLAQLLGLAVPPSFDGQSLLPELTGAAGPPRPGVYSELIPDKKVPARAYSFITDRFHLIVNPASRSRELFDLQADPTEQRNLADAPPPEAAEVEAALRRHLALRHGAIETRIATPAEQKTGGWAFEDEGKGGD